MPRKTLLSGCCLLAIVALVGPAHAVQIDLSLNLLYDTPTDSNSGGTWQVAAKSDGQGIAWFTFRLTGQLTESAQFVAPQGVLSGTADAAGFVASVFDFTTPEPTTDFVVDRNRFITPGDEVGVFYGVGTLANGEPGDIGPAYALDSTTNTPWATGDDLGDSAWDTAAVFFTGTFAPGDAPEFFEDTGASPIVPTGSVYTSLTGVSETTAADNSPSSATVMTTVVRDNLQNLPGDYNLDGVVDAVDYAVWRESLGQSVAPVGSGADGQPDGIINALDYAVWRDNYGNAAAGPTAALGVSAPSPAGQILLFFGAFQGIVLGRRRPRFAA